GVEVIELPKEANGLDFLIKTLGQYQDLSAVHIFSHANAGELFLGNTKVDKKALQNNVEAFNKLNKAIIKGGDLLFYGCELGKGKEGEEFLDIIKGNTHVDVAAFNNYTGNHELDGDLNLEIQKGDPSTQPRFDSVAMSNFDAILSPFSGTLNFDNVPTGYVNAINYTIPTTSYTMRIQSGGAGSSDVGTYGTG